ncbi:hypothetical protein AAY473_008244 [Plecturocebus cupreus]
MGFLHVGQVGLELIGNSRNSQVKLSGDPLTLAFQTSGIIDQEIPDRGATWVASVTLLAGAAVLPAPSAALPSAKYTGQTDSAGPILTRKTAVGSAED